MSRKFSIAVLPFALAAGLMMGGQPSHALQTAPLPKSMAQWADPLWGR
jgi:hypothetical protein